MAKNKVVVLVDFHWVLCRSGFKFAEFKIEQEDRELKTGGMYGCLELAKTIYDYYDNPKVIWCMDGVPKRRQALYPEYKAQRHEKEPPEEIVHAKSLRDEVVKVLSFLPGTDFYFDPELEADDLMAMMAFREKGKGNTPILFTGDKDLLQLMQYGINISKEIEEGKPLVLKENYIALHKDFQVAPEELLYYRALDGDTSDNIDAALGGNKEVKRLFARKWYESGDKYLENFDKVVDSCIPEIEELFKGKKAQQNNIANLRTCKEKAIRNMKMMELDFYKPVEDAYAYYKETGDKSKINEVREKFMSNIEIKDYDLDASEVRDILKEYDMNRFLAWAKFNSYI